MSRSAERARRPTAAVMGRMSDKGRDAATSDKPDLGIVHTWHPDQTSEMHILLAHDYYRSSAPSGEDAVFRNETELLRKYGCKVTLFERFNDEIDESSFNKRLRLALNGAWSRSAYTDLSDLIRETRPDIAHFHNTFPLISPSAYAACQDNGVPVVQTLHNYRLVCPGALLMRDGRPCEDCLGTSLIPALWNRCYRGSLAATGAQVWTITSNRWRGTYVNRVNRYIALSHFAVTRLIAGGLPAKRIEVKPNFLPDAPPAGQGGGGYAIYAGRLTAEKGVRTLINAWKLVKNLNLKVLGDGNLREELEEKVRSDGSTVEFLGFRSRSEILALAAQAEVVVIPSECYEGFPMAILEAYACGTPVVVARIGSLDEIVIDDRTGVKFEVGNAHDLAAKVNALFLDRDRLRLMRRNARAAFEENYTAENNFRQLTTIYQHAIEDFDSCRSKR